MSASKRRINNAVVLPERGAQKPKKQKDRGKSEEVGRRGATGTGRKEDVIQRLWKMMHELAG